MSKARNLALVSLAIGIITVILITYNVGFSEILSLLARASLLFIVCYLVTSLLIASMLTLKWKVILNAHGVDVPYNRLFMYRLAGYSVSYLTPSAHVGGEPIRAYLLQTEKVPINTAFSSVIIDKAIEIFTDIMFFFFGVLIILNSFTVEPTMKIIILGISLGLILLVGIFIGGILGKQSMFVSIFRFLRLNKIKSLKAAEQNLADIERQIEEFYRQRKDSFLIIFIIMIILWGLMFLEYRFALLMLAEVASPVQIFLILTGVGLAYSIPIPAAVGTLELGQLSAAKVLGLSATTAIGLAFIIRARDLIWTVLGIIFLGINQLSFRKLSRHTKNLDREFQEGKIIRKRDNIDIKSERNPHLKKILSRWKYKRTRSK